MKNYDLFGTKNTEDVKHALQISPNKIIIYLEKKIHTDTIKLWRVKFNSLEEAENFTKETILGFSAEYRENQIIITGDFNPYYNYRIELNKQEIPVILDPATGGILDTYFAPNETENFGAKIQPECVSFKLWSPPAVGVKLLLFDTDAETLLADNICLKKSDKGVHSVEIYPENFGKTTLENCFYQYKIYAYGKITTALDPYAKSMAAFNPKDYKTAKAAIIKIPNTRPKPEFDNSDIIKTSMEAVVYELHTRDFSIEPNFCNPTQAGTFSAIGEHTEYFKQLGITHLQFMPVNKCHTQNDTDKNFSDNLTETNSYNWGYDPLNYFTLEGRYSQNPLSPEARINEFRDMAAKLHKSGIGLIADVVFNHIYSATVFENLAPGCYLRFNENFEISEHTGAGPSLESRHLITRKLILDVGKYYVNVLGFDGFRFDLMEFTDNETLSQFRNEVGKAYNADNPYSLILQGEAWEFKDIDYRDSFTKLHRPKGLGISMFNDVMRDSALGHKTEGGFFQGHTHRIADLASAIVGGISDFDQNDFPFAQSKFFHPYNLFADEPADCLNYLSIHDGLTLFDKIKLTMQTTNKNLLLKIAKQSLTALFTAQGRVILHGGTELLRSKPAIAEEKNSPRVFNSEIFNSKTEFTHFHENSYKSPDFTNMMRHSNRKNEYAPLVSSMSEYLQGLIKMRKTTEAFRYEKNEDICKALKFLTNENEPVANFSGKFNSFKSHRLKKLEIEFINGPKNDILFMAGEIHPEDANPTKHPIYVRFDKNGRALINFSRKEINNFDLGKWQAWHLLNIKLVRTPGEWDIPTEYYSASGSNSLTPYNINSDFRITIDLSKKDASSYFEIQETSNNYLAYRILNLRPIKNSTPASSDCFFVIHNVSNNQLDFSHTELRAYNKLLLICDSVKFNETGLNTNEKTAEKYISQVKTETGRVHIPPHCSVIIAAYK